MEAATASTVSAVGTIFAIITSIVSIAVSISALKSKSAHDRKSVKPILQVKVGDYEGHLHVRLDNVGTGPAIIASAQFRHPKGIHSTLLKCVPALAPPFFWDDFVGSIDGRAIPAQGSLELLSFSGASEKTGAQYPHLASINARDGIRDALKDVTIIVTYVNIYDEVMPSCIRKLDWFGRDKLGQTKKE